jgi:GT2 family glycosyltransferase
VVKPQERGPSVSVIVPVYNGDVMPLLETLALQTYPSRSFEVIFGDDGSDPPLAIQDVPGGLNVVVVRGPRRNSYAARNRAIRNARSPILAFCDVDCRPAPDWLERGLAADAALLAGEVCVELPRSPNLWQMLDVDTFLDQERHVRNGIAATANLFVYRDLFSRCGGFDERFPSGGDADFTVRCSQSGHRPVYRADVRVFHPARSTGGDLLQKVWRVNRSLGARTAADGSKPRASRLRAWTPIIGTLRLRQRVGKPALVNRARLEANAVTAPRITYAMACLVLYSIQYYVGLTAQLIGARSVACSGGAASEAPDRSAGRPSSVVEQPTSQAAHPVD